ncbi:MAG: phosphoglycolate phosphatase [Gammaproteobacteria bacterium]|nr:phosphoglycolate phosphatase [Gammaproteobacteria bacterium]MBU1414739.1 phosphoglycolate phosphatase [Gammaproteobacteria bacterium]
MSFPAKAVLLDLDGTLLDTVLDLHAAANGMLADLGRPPVAIEDIRAYVGRGIPNLVKRVLAGNLDAADDPAPPPDAALTSFKRHYTEVNGHAAKPFPGVMEGLAALRAKGLLLGVITNKARAFTCPLLDRTGLHPFLSVAVSGDDLPRPKPDPMPVTWACGRLGVSPADVVLIGDSVNDLKAGHAAGCRVLLVPYGYNEGQDVRGLECDAIVATILDAASRITPA